MVVSNARALVFGANAERSELLRGLECSGAYVRALGLEVLSFSCNLVYLPQDFGFQVCAILDLILHCGVYK